MYGQLVLGRSRLTIEVVAGEPDEERGGASELKGYWLVVTETDAAGDGLEVRVAVDPTVAEVLVASWREHLASAGREVTDDALRELMEREGDGTVRTVTPITDAAGRPNRRQRRAEQFGDGLAAQDATAARAVRDATPKRGES
jgi:hypothetical protein